MQDLNANSFEEIIYDEGQPCLVIFSRKSCHVCQEVQRACMGKGFLNFFKEVDADFFCLQETKMQPEQLSLELPGTNIAFIIAISRWEHNARIVIVINYIMII